MFSCRLASSRKGHRLSFDFVRVKPGEPGLRTRLRRESTHPEEATNANGAGNAGTFTVSRRIHRALCTRGWATDGVTIACIPPQEGRRFAFFSRVQRNKLPPRRAEGSLCFRVQRNKLVPVHTINITGCRISSCCTLPSTPNEQLGLLSLAAARFTVALRFRRAARATAGASKEARTY